MRKDTNERVVLLYCRTILHSLYHLHQAFHAPILHTNLPRHQISKHSMGTDRIPPINQFDIRLLANLSMCKNETPLTEAFSKYPQVPFHRSWTNWMYKTPPVKCLDFTTVMNCWLGFTVVHDLIIIAFPIPLLWNLNLPRSKKIQLCLMFSLGFFIIACSCARIPALKHMRYSTDQSCKFINQFKRSALSV